MNFQPGTQKAFWVMSKNHHGSYLEDTRYRQEYMISIPSREILPGSALAWKHQKTHLLNLFKVQINKRKKKKENIPGGTICPNIQGGITYPEKTLKGWLNKLFAPLISVTPLELGVVKWSWLFWLEYLLRASNEIPSESISN